MSLATRIISCVLVLSMLTAVACDDEPTQETANEAFCDAVSEYVASLRVFRDLDRSSTVQELEDARERSREAYEQVVETAKDVGEVRLDSLQTAREDLQDAVDDIDDQASLAEALSIVDDELEKAAVEAGKALNDVDCGGQLPFQRQSDE